MALSICMSLMSNLANHFSFDNEFSHGRKQSPRVLGSRVTVLEPVTSSFLFQNLALLYSSSIFIQIADALFCLFIQADEYIRVVCQGVKLIKYRHCLFSDTLFRFPLVCYLGDPSEAFPISRIRLHGDAPPNISSGQIGFIWKILFENSCLKRLLFMK